MLTLSNLVPPSDALDRVKDVEKNLRQRRNVGLFGWVVLIGSGTLQIAAAINSAGLFSLADLWAENRWLAVIIVLSALLVIGAALTVVWSTFWLKESKRPFRYTCSVGTFEPVSDQEQDGQPEVTEAMSWLPIDLSRCLNERVQRFEFLDSEKAASSDTDEAEETRAHIHVYGSYVIREADADGRESKDKEIEITAKVRVGSSDSPEVLAPTPPPIVISESSKFDRDKYNDLLERIYHSVVSEVYRQLREDVARKIELLPTSRLRAIALLHEADDYARSNTLHAYDQATGLYFQAAAAIDPTLTPKPNGRIPRFLHTSKCRFSRFRSVLRHVEGHYRPGVLELDILRARAIMGYALMLCFRRLLSQLVGEQPNESFEALKLIGVAAESLDALSADAPEFRDTRFECLTTMALCLSLSGDSRSALAEHDRARQLHTTRAKRDPVHLFVRANVSTDSRTRLAALRQAVELAPRFELAQGFLAYEIEELWRSRESLEPTVAEMVLDEYKNLLKINPSNLAAWANSAYICWLLGGDHLDRAEEYYLQGRAFKEIKRDVYVSELDYGLARIHAERGQFSQAYEKYVASVSRLVSGGDFKDYYYQPSTPASLRRYEEYYRNFSRHSRKHRADSHGAVNDRELKRLRHSIHAFVLCDLGEAYSWGRFSESVAAVTPRSALERRTKQAFQGAIRLNDQYVFPYYLLAREFADFEECRDYLVRATKLEPMWATAQLELVERFARAAPEAEREAEAINDRRKRKAEREDELERLKKHRPTWLGASPGATENARRISSAILRRYSSDIKQSRLPSGSKKSIPSALTGRPADPDRPQELDKLQSEIAVLAEEIGSHEKTSRIHKATAEHYRGEAQQLIKKLIPHAWLWKGDEFDWGALGDPRYARDLVWEREFTRDHVLALYQWALRFQHDKDGQDRALRLFQFIVEHFYPADANSLDGILKIRLNRAAGKPARKKLVMEFASRNHSIIERLPDLEEFGFNVDEEIELLTIALDDPNVVDRSRDRISDKLADALERKAGSRERKEEVSDLLQRALAIAHSNHGVANLHLEYAKARLPTNDLTILENAIEHVAKADELLRYPNATLRRRDLDAQRDQLLREEGCASEWGEAASRFTTLQPALSVRLSSDLKPLTDLSVGEENRTKEARLSDLSSGLYWELGLLFPRPKIAIDFQVTEKCRYCIDVRGLQVASDELRLDRRLVNATPEYLAQKGIEAVEAINPASGSDCAYVADSVYEEHKETIDGLGYSWDAFGYLILHIASILRKYAAELLRVDDVVELLEFNGLHDDLRAFEGERRLPALAAVLSALVAEGLSIRPLPLIVRIFRAESANRSNLSELAEAMRRHPDFRRTIPYLSMPRHKFVPLSPEFEDQIAIGLENGGGRVLALEPAIAQDLLTSVRRYTELLEPDSINPVILTKPEHRLWVRRLVELEFPNFQVLSEREVLPENLSDVVGELELL